VDGVPERTPVDGDSDISTGSLPEVILHVYPGVPPVAARVTLYGVPEVLEGNEVVVIEREPVVVLPAAEIIMGTATDFAPETKFCTCNCAVPGIERLAV